MITIKKKSQNIFKKIRSNLFRRLMIRSIDKSRDRDVVVAATSSSTGINKFLTKSAHIPST